MLEQMTETMSLPEAFRANDIRQAVVIDDAFDIDIAEIISSENCDTFEYELRQDPAITDELGKIGVEPSALLKREVTALQNLFENRELLDKARPAVDIFFNEYLDKIGLVDELVRHLRKLKLEVIKLGADEPFPDQLKAQIAFIDFYLDESVPPTFDSSSSEVDPSEKAKKKARDVYDRSQAYIILMSSREEVRLEEAAFRKKARLLRGYYQFQPKEALSDDNLLYECLSGLPLKADFRHTLHDFIDCLDQRSAKIASSFVDQVRDLGLEDYAQLRQLSLNKDGHPFGDYIIRLFGHFLTSMVMEDPELGHFIAKLDNTTFTSLLPVHAEPSATLGRIYLASLTEKLRTPITAKVEASPEKGTNKIPQLVPLNLGDLFVKDTTSPIYAVINPACDLALGATRSRKPDDSVLLIPGSLRQLYESYEGDRSPTMFTSIYEMNDLLYRIDWDYRKIRTMIHEEIPQQLLVNGYRCERRLQLGPALELQQHFASSLSRVGLPVSPPIRRLHDATIYCRGVECEWEEIGKLEATIVALHMRDKDEFVISRKSVKPALEAIKTHIETLIAATTDGIIKGDRKRFTHLLEDSMKKWAGHFPFLHSPGNMPGGRCNVKCWSDKTIEIKDRLGVSRDTSSLNESLKADAVLVVDLSGFSEQAANPEELSQEME